MTEQTDNNKMEENPLPSIQKIEIEDVEFTDRYAAIGMPYPNRETMCLGECDGTGYVPIKKSHSLKEPWKSLWHAAEAEDPAEDGWHFVTCPSCNGTGLRDPMQPIEATEPTDDIKDMELQLLELSETIEELSKSTREFEQTHTLIIEEKWESTKDKSLSNASKRDLAVKEILSGIQDYTEMKDELESLRKIKSRMEIEFRFMLREEKKERMNVDISIAEALSMLLKKV